MGLFDKAKKLADRHGDKIAKGVDSATDAVDKKTGGKYREHLDKVDDAARNLDKTGERRADPTEPRPADPPTSTPPTPPTP